MVRLKYLRDRAKAGVLRQLCLLFTRRLPAFGIEQLNELDGVEIGLQALATATETHDLVFVVCRRFCCLDRFGDLGPHFVAVSL